MVKGTWAATSSLSPATTARTTASASGASCRRPSASLSACQASLSPAIARYRPALRNLIAFVVIVDAGADDTRFFEPEYSAVTQVCRWLQTFPFLSFIALSLSLSLSLPLSSPMQLVRYSPRILSNHAISSLGASKGKCGAGGGCIPLYRTRCALSLFTRARVCHVSAQHLFRCAHCACSTAPPPSFLLTICIAPVSIATSLLSPPCDFPSALGRVRLRRPQQVPVHPPHRDQGVARERRGVHGIDG